MIQYDCLRGTVQDTSQDMSRSVMAVTREWMAPDLLARSLFVMSA